MRSSGEFRSQGFPQLVLCLSLALGPGLSFGFGNMYKEFAGFPGMDRLPHSNWADMTKTPLFPVLPLVVSQIASSGGDELCRTQSEIFLRELRNFTLWAVQMFDASTKFPDGVVSGNSYHMGNFDQCVGIKVDLSSASAQNMLYGQYCLAAFNFMEEEQQIKNYTLDPYSMTYHPKRTAWDRIKYSGDPTKSRRDVIHWSLCIPASCSPTAVENALVQAINWVNEVYGKSLNIKVRILERMCTTNRKDEFLTAYDITFSVFLITLAIVVIAATAFDLNTMNDAEEDEDAKTGMVKKMLLCFSAQKNFQNIFQVKGSDNDHGFICIHCPRFMIMLLIIMGHRFQAIIGGPLFNPEVVEQGYRRPEGSFLINGLIIVDTFFVFGGFLTTYFLLIELDKRKNLNFIKLFILRFVRLTPVYAVVVIFHATLFYKMGSGPLWDSKVGLERDRCVSSWWTNLLYINNYVMNDKMCVIQSWFMSCDMQFFILSLFIVYIVWKKPRIGLVLLGIAAFLSLIIPFLIIYMEHKDAMLLPYIRNLKDVQSNENFISFYIKAHNRAGPYMVGIITGLS